MPVPLLPSRVRVLKEHGSCVLRSFATWKTDVSMIKHTVTGAILVECMTGDGRPRRSCDSFCQARGRIAKSWENIIPCELPWITRWSIFVKSLALFLTECSVVVGGLPSVVKAWYHCVWVMTSESNMAAAWSWLTCSCSQTSLIYCPFLCFSSWLFLSQ